MQVSVVVPAFNARDQLRILLRTLSHNQTDPADSFEVVVADDGSTDGTGDMAAAMSVPFPLTLLHLPRTERSSRAAARNAAIAAAGGELIIMLDADHVIAPDYIRQHIRYHRLRDDLVVVGPRPDLGAGTFDENRLAEEFTFEAVPPVAWADPRGGLLRELGGNLNQTATCWHLLWTCNASVRAGHLEAVGGFDEEFLGWGLEDTELGYRLRQRGLAFAFNSAAIAYHQRSRMVDEAMFTDYSRNLALMTAKHDVEEVALQSVIAAALNPAVRRLPWTEAAKRFEYAVRALNGRLPTGRRKFGLLTADPSNAATVAQAVAARSADEDLLVIDDTPEADLAGPIQCIDTPRELLYYHRPAAEQRSAIFDRFQVTA